MIDDTFNAADDAADEAIAVIYRDEYVVAVDKPAGMVVHRSRAARDAQACLGIVRGMIGRWVYPAHRLDRGTSGVLLFATDSDTARVLGNAFAMRAVNKNYLAVVRGWPDDEGVVDHPIARDEDARPAAAQTSYRTLARTEQPYAVSRYPTSRYALLLAQPHTGRTHQIRRHMAHISHPVIGDTIYGQGAHNRLFRDVLEVRRLMLHAWRLEIPHPHTGDVLHLEAPLPEGFRRIIDRFAWNDTPLDSGAESAHRREATSDPRG